MRDRLAAASLARLNAPDPETFQADARFALDALPALTTRPDQIKALRQTILNLAVRGKLVPQDANDEPASELLRVARNGKIGRTRREVKKSISEPTCCKLPNGWALARLARYTRLNLNDRRIASDMQLIRRRRHSRSFGKNVRRFGLFATDWFR